jgi:deoxyribodipyrimidine photo-lyase
VRILFWFRKDLRLDDNVGLHAAARDGDVIPFYASEPAILRRPDLAATRVRFVLDSLEGLAAACERAGSHLALDHGDAIETVVRAARACGADAVYWNDEYEPALRRCDDAVEVALRAAGVRVRRFHDRLLVAPGEVMNKAGQPFVVYTPFRRACEELPLPSPVPDVTRLAPHALPRRSLAILERLGCEEPAAARWKGGAARERLDAFLADGLARYDSERDLPAAGAGSRLSADLRFGTISVRTVAARVLAHGTPAAATKFVSELRWRDFYAHVLFHFPHVETGAFKREFDALEWEDDPTLLDAWRAGRTGYPMVDAGMRELAATGFMHNRVRMIVASFLAKDLLLDWRLGERHFMNHLVDGDLASNNGGWQWAAGTGTDAQPYFRIFNPQLQGEKFDPEGEYVRRWVPELSKVSKRHVHRPWQATPHERGAYPDRVVVHEDQRPLALAMYGAVRS